MAPFLSKCVKDTLRAAVRISDLKRPPDTSHLPPKINRGSLMKAWALYDAPVAVHLDSLTLWDGIRHITKEGIKICYDSMLVSNMLCQLSS